MPAEAFQKQPPEKAAEYPHGEKEAGSAGHPLTVGREPASGHDAVQVRMEVKVLSPAVKDGEEADLRAQMLGIAGDGEERFRDGAEEKIVDRVFVVERNAGDLLGEGEDYVEVLLAKARVGWVRVRHCVAGSTWRVPLPGIWGNAGCGRSGIGRE